MSIRSQLIALLATLALVGVVVPGAPVRAQEAADTVQIIGEDERPSPSDITVRLSRTTPLPSPQRVLIARDDEFADALASGLLQGEAPLLMVPSTGPIPQVVTEEIQRLGVTRATILGGPAAVGVDVEQQLSGLGLATERRQGNSRFETAIAIAAEVPAADTVMLARAGSSDPVNNPSQGFADALGAGAVAAENRWPILLTDTASLTPVTREYLAGSAVRNVNIVGGTAAVSPGVEDELRTMGYAVERIAAPDRFGTATEVAKEIGADDVGDVAEVILVDGTSPDGFVGGFAAAARAAHLDAPIVLADGISIPAATQAFLEPGAAFAQAGDPVAITCVVHPLACDGGRETLGLVDFPLLEAIPAIDRLVTPGQGAEIRLSPAEEGRNMPITIKGSCIDGQIDTTTDPSGFASFSISQGASGTTCSVDVTYGTGSDVLSQGYNYALSADAARTPGTIGVASEVFSYGTALTSTPLYVTDDIACSGPAGTAQRQDAAYEASYLHPDGFVEVFSLTSFPFEAFPGDTCTAVAQVPTGVGRVQWGVYSWSDSGLRNPLLLGNGTTADFTFDDLGTEVSDVNVVWILETHEPSIGQTPPPAPGLSGQVFNPEGLPIDCGQAEVIQGLNILPPGTPCTTGNTVEGLDLLVVEHGRPLVTADAVDFAAPTDGFPVALYTVVTGEPTLEGPTAESCATTTDELPFTVIVPGMVTASHPADYWFFEGFAGEELRFRADNASGDFATGLDPILTAYAPDGSLAGSNDDGDYGLNSRLDLTIEQTGTYCVEVSGFGQSTGDYLLTADPAPVFSDAQVLTAQQPFLDYTYDGRAGDRLVVEHRATGFDATDPLLELYDPGGNFILGNDDGGGYPNARIEYTLPADGVYFIRATVFGESYGAFVLEASVFAPVRSRLHGGGSFGAAQPAGP